MPDPNRLELPAGYGFKVVPKGEWWQTKDSADFEEAFFDRLAIWEKPRQGHRYVLGVDVSDGLGLDRSVVDVLRVGTLTEPDEQVAQFVSSTIDPIDLAHIIDPIGRFYRDQTDDTPGLVAIECNNHGIATQAEIMRHIGYYNLFVWQYEDARDPRRRYSTKFGWYTTARTRPIILARYVKGINTIDPHTGFSDYRINSFLTQEELRDFQAPPGGALWQASAANGAHDDCIMAGAITVHVGQTLHFEDGEPLEDKRRRQHEEKKRKEELAEKHERRADFQNTDAGAWEMNDDVEDEVQRSPYDKEEAWPN